jgi:hypothetical protein
MEEIFSDIKSGRWWFSTVAVAIAVSIISNIIWELIIKKHLIDKNKGYKYYYSNNRYIYYIDRYYKFYPVALGH